MPADSRSPTPCRATLRRAILGRTILGRAMLGRTMLGRTILGRTMSALVLVLLASSCSPDHGNRVVIGCKNFTEQLVLAEIMAQQIEAQTHLAVERRYYLAGTLIAQQAILGGRIDLYPEYTGTALTTVLKQRPVPSDEVYGEVKDEYARRFHLLVGRPFGFNDTFAIEIRGDDARRLGLKTISQAAAYAPHWRAGFGYEFMERPDGYAGLAATYGLHFAEPPRIMDLGLITRALREKQVDLIAGNMTDGLIPTFDLFVLADDKHYFPPYEAVPIFRQAFVERHPEVEQALDRLAGRISDDAMRRLNYAIDGERRDVKQVAAEFLRGIEP